MKYGSNLPKHLLTAAAVLTLLAGFSVIAIYQVGLDRNEEPATHRTKIAGIPERPVKIPILRPETAGTSSHENFSQQKSETQIVESRNRREPTLQAEDLSGTEIVKGVGLTVNQLRALHAMQRREFESSEANSSLQIAAPGDEALSGLSIEDLLRLHEEQKRNFESDYRVDEIVIPPSEDGTPGITVVELLALHEQQNSMSDNPQNLFEEVPAPAPVEEDSMGSVAELMDVHDRQWEQEFTDSNEVASPPPEDGGPGLTVQQLKKLHESQTILGK